MHFLLSRTRCSCSGLDHDDGSDSVSVPTQRFGVALKPPTTECQGFDLYLQQKPHPAVQCVSGGATVFALAPRALLFRFTLQKADA